MHLLLFYVLWHASTEMLNGSIKGKLDPKKFENPILDPILNVQNDMKFSLKRKLKPGVLLVAGFK